MPSPISAADILGHSGFAPARDRHVGTLVRLYRGDRFVIWMMADAAVITLRGLICSFHAAHRPDDPATWATPKRLRDIIVAAGLASPRRVDGMIARFRQAAYVEAEAVPSDRRLRLLRPSARLLTHDRAHLAAYHRFLRELFPGRGYEWVETGDPVVHLAVRRSALRDLSGAMRFRHHPAMMHFLVRDGGYLAFLLAAALDRAGERMTLGAMSEALGVSRTQIRSLFAQARAEGYVRLPDGDGPVRIEPVLWEAHARFLADVMAAQDTIAQAAITEDALARAAPAS